ncbi:MAG TPA: DUF885 domain-containing protein [Opitutaceae bacterium]|nr:DUF885 domain-containing protein [Opitutaceae bacterium]
MKSARSLIACVLLLCTAASGRAATPTLTFDAWADSFSAEWMRLSPASITRTQYFSGEEQDAFDRQLTLVGEWGDAYGRKAIAQRAALARRGLEELKAHPRAGLTAQQRTSAALLEWTFKNVIEGAAFPLHDPIFNQFSGLQLEFVNFLTQTHPIRKRRDIENYLARLDRVAPLMDEAIADARAAEQEGLLPPRFIVQRMIEQLDGFLMLPAKDNVFVSSLNARIGLLGAAISPEERGAFVAAAGKIAGESVLPVFGRLRALFAAQLPRTNDDAGVWRLPRGADRYQQSLANFTTTPLGYEEIHAIGLREVARLEGEMDEILRELGYHNGTVNARYAELDLALQPPAEPDPRPAILAENEKWVRDAERRAATLFDVLPKAPVIVKREPPFSERTAAAHYSDPAPDGSKPGIFWLPLPGPLFGRMRTRSLCYHEAVPGHHFQLALQQEMPDLPRFRRLGVYGFISAYGEGWALYAERLADEQGWYAGDPHGRLGYLNSLLFRARRLVVDTGLHVKKWTRQQAIDYGINAQEVERYVVWPGQACSYMIGQLRIVELRENAKAALGDGFSIQQFHNVVLKAGNVPLDVLAQLVDAWVAEQKHPK